jgi:hypothetical protein
LAQAAIVAAVSGDLASGKSREMVWGILPRRKHAACWPNSRGNRQLSFGKRAHHPGPPRPGQLGSHDRGENLRLFDDGRHNLVGNLQFPLGLRALNELIAVS